MCSPNVLWHKLKEIHLNHSWDSNFPDHWFMPGMIVCVKTSFLSPSLALLFALNSFWDEKTPFLILCLHNIEKTVWSLFLHSAICCFNLPALSTEGGEYQLEKAWLMVSSEAGRGDSRII